MNSKPYSECLFGWKNATRRELVEKISQSLEIDFEAHDSDYFGEYELFEDEEGEVRLYDNFRDQDGALLEPNHPEYKTFLRLDGSMLKYTDVIKKFAGATLLK